jgi:hypothetical protein
LTRHRHYDIELHRTGQVLSLFYKENCHGKIKGHAERYEKETGQNGQRKETGKAGQEKIASAARDRNGQGNIAGLSIGKETVEAIAGGGIN